MGLRGHDEQGTTAVELCLVLVAVAAIALAAIVAARHLGGDLFDSVRAAICRMADLGCNAPGAPCTVGLERLHGNVDVEVAVVEVGADLGYAVERLSNGRARVTFARNGGVGLGTGGGGVVTIETGEGGSGAGASASSSARLAFGEGLVVDVASEEQAWEFVRWHAGHVVAPALGVSAVPFVGPALGRALAAGEPEIRARWPAMSTYLSAAVAGEVYADGGHPAGIARGVLQAAAGMRRDQPSGDTTLFWRLRSDVIARGPEGVATVSGDAEATASLTLDGRGDAQVLELSGAAGVLASLGVGGLTVDDAVAVRATLDLRDAGNARAARRFLAEAVQGATARPGSDMTGATHALGDRILDGGTVTVSRHEVRERRRWGATVRAGTGVNAGLSLGGRRERIVLADAWYWERDTRRLRRWIPCTNAVR